MLTRQFPGRFELPVLLALIRIGEEAYGVPISSRLGEPTAERRGRAKTYFRVTDKGLRAARQAQRTSLKLWTGVPQLQGGTT
jgi:PadR family transcriptional regulator PadR